MKGNFFFPFPFHFRLRWKLALLVLILNIVLGSALVIGTRIILFSSLEVELEQKGAILVKYLADTVQEPYLTKDLILLQRHLERAVEFEDDILYAFISVNGRFPLVHTFPGDFPKDLVTGHLPDNDQNISIQVFDTEQGYIRDFASPLLSSRDDLFLHAGLSENHLYEAVSSAGNILYTVIAVFAVICFFAVLILSAVITKPLEMLAQGAEEVGRGTLGKKLAVMTNDEIGDLAKTFNAMTGNLSRLMDERFRTEKELKETLNLLEKIAHGIGEGILLLDLDFTIIWANNYILQHYGVALEQVKGRRCHEVTHNSATPCRPPHDPCPILLYDVNSKPVPYEHVHLDREGSEEAVEVVVYPLKDENGDVYQYLHISRDISDRHVKLKLEEQLRQSQKIEAIGRLSGSMAHDFNNILTTIVGFSELGKLSLQDDEPLRENFESILQAGQRGAELTRQLLAFSRKQVIKTRVVNLNFIVANFSKMLHRLVGEDVILQLVSHVSQANIEADPSQMEQVIMNLAVNAKEAMTNGGEIRIETDVIQLEEYHDAERDVLVSGSFVMLSVSDTGQGMQLKDRGKIFEPFYTTKSQGTGLGLATVYGIVKQHGGYIDVESALGKGTTFTLYFPEVDEQEESADLSAVDLKRDMPTGNETILLVDDQKDLIDLIAEVLSSLGYHTIGATGAEEAIGISRNMKGPIDLLLTDIVMPRMNGVELARILKHERPGLKVVYLSGYADAHLGDDGKIDDSIQYIEKPILPSAMARKIREVLDTA